MRKKSVFTLTLLFLLGLVFITPAKPDSLQTSIIPDNAWWVTHLDVEKFITTRFFELLRQNKTIGLEEKILGISKKFKFDPFKDIMGITIFGIGKNEKNTVVCLSGNFNKDHLFILLDMNINHRKIPYGKYMIHNWDRLRFGTFVNDKLVVIANNESVLKNVLDVIAGKKKNFSASKLMPHLRGIPKDAFLRSMIDKFGIYIGVGGSNSMKKVGMASFIALERNQNLTIKIKLTTDSPEAAKNIQYLVMGFLALAKLKQDNDKVHPLLTYLDKLKIKLDKNIVHMELSSPSQELIDIIALGKGPFDMFD